MLQLEASEKSSQAHRLKLDWWPLVLLLVMVLAFGAFVFLGKESPLSGQINVQAHNKSQRKAEVDRRFKEGVRMLKAKEYAPALDAFHRVLELAPEMPEAHVNTGFALLGVGDFKTAADFFDTATTLNPNQLNAYYGLGEALAGLGNYQGALQAMEAYVHLAPPSDPFRRKAESAAWEIRAKLDEDKLQMTKVAPSR